LVVTDERAATIARPTNTIFVAKQFGDFAYQVVDLTPT
jgi:hypothetical protein